jgi:hypothetical protein
MSLFDILITQHVSACLTIMRCAKSLHRAKQKETLTAPQKINKSKTLAAHKGNDTSEFEISS